MAWEGIKSAIPPALIQILIEKVISMIVPAAGAVLAIIEGLQAAWGTVSRVIQAFDRFMGFLKAVKTGQSGPQFGAALAAAGVVLIDFVSNWLLKRVRGAASKVAGKVKEIAKKIGRKLKAATKKLGGKFGKVKDKFFGKKGNKEGKDSKHNQDNKHSNEQKADKDSKNKEKLDKAVRELEPKIRSLLQRGVSGIRLRAQLAFWRLSYRLSELRVNKQGGRGLQFFAKVNPEAVFGNGVKIEGNELLRFIREVVRDEVLKHPKVQTAAQAIQQAKTSGSNRVHLTGPEYFPAAAMYYRNAPRSQPKPPKTASARQEKIQIGSEPTIVSETQKQSNKGTPSEKVNGLGTYPEISKELEVLAQGSGGLSNAQLAQAMQELIQTGKLPDALAKKPGEDLNTRRQKEKLQKKLTRLSWLMFGTESERNPATIATAPMTLELIAKGKMDWKEAFDSKPQISKDGKFVGGAGAFPMSMKDAVPASRRVDDDANPQTFPKRTGEVGTKETANELRQREIDLVVRWVNEIGIQGGEINANDEQAIKQFIVKKVKEFYMLQ
jgi:hypothetical protein